jgi:hypothetical protein
MTRQERRRRRRMTGGGFRMQQKRRRIFHRGASDTTRLQSPCATRLNSVLSAATAAQPVPVDAVRTIPDGGADVRGALVPRTTTRWAGAGIGRVLWLARVRHDRRGCTFRHVLSVLSLVALAVEEVGVCTSGGNGAARSVGGQAHQQTHRRGREAL